MTGGELDISAFLLFPVDGWFWKVRGSLINTRASVEIMCVIVEARVEFKKKQ